MGIEKQTTQRASIYAKIEIKIQCGGSEEMTSSYEGGWQRLTEAPMSQVSPGRWLQFCQASSGAVGLTTCFVPSVERVLPKYLLNGLSKGAQYLRMIL